MSAPPAPLRAVDLVKTYRAGRGKPPVRALDGLSVDIEPGIVFALLGPNGAGKSTAVRVFTTLTRPDSGTATVAGIDVLRHPDAVRSAIGLVSQKSSGDPMATGRENLVLAARIQGLPAARARARAGELLARFGLTEAADRLVKTWSGGMARKLDVALGVVHRPRVLFLDEPTTGLDPESRAGMWAEITALAADEQVTVLLTTHYLDEADRMARRMAIVDAGRVVVEGTPEELKRRLHGDTVQVELTEQTVAAGAAVLRGVGGLSEVAVEGTTVRARATAGAGAVPAVLTALGEGGIPAESVTVGRPSLDDVYLRYVGRRFAEQSSGSAAEVAA
jgi:ABC-2 type transport system ATP-binding protein